MTPPHSPPHTQYSTWRASTPKYTTSRARGRRTRRTRRRTAFDWAAVEQLKPEDRQPLRSYAREVPDPRRGSGCSRRAARAPPHAGVLHTEGSELSVLQGADLWASGPPPTTLHFRRDGVETESARQVRPPAMPKRLSPFSHTGYHQVKVGR